MKKIFSFIICLVLCLSVFTFITPAASNHISVTYQTYDDYRGRFLPNVTDLQDYAGIFGHAVDCVYANLSQGNITYKVHVKGGNWLPEVTNRSDYAGIKGKPIDGLMIKTDTGRTVKYRVHILGGQWLSYVTGYNQYDSTNGYAGIYGKTIDAVQIYVEDSATPVQRPGVIADGTYYLSPKCAPNSVMDVVNGSSTGAIQLYSKANVLAQQFTLKHLGNSYYTITCCTGKVLDGGSSYNGQGTKIEQYPSNGSKGQKWLIKASGDGDYFNICSGANNSLCMDVINGWSANGTRIQLYQNVNVNAQKWRFIPVAESAMFPVSSQLNLTTIAYEYGPGGARHNSSNAMDCTADSKTEYALAPFTGKVVYVGNDCNAVWFQSNDKVLYADGTFDYMTVIFMHGRNRSELVNAYNSGKVYRQGDPLYQEGDVGSAGQYHFHIEVIRGKGNSWDYRGSVFAYNAFFVKNGTPVYNQGIMESRNWLSGAPGDALKDWTGKWKFKN